MTYLVDANVLSEPTKLNPNSKVVDWLVAHEREFVINSIILGEIYVGVLGMRSGRKRAQLDRWFERVAQTIVCLSWDAGISFRWAEMVVELKRKGRVMPLLDSLIAATALKNNLTVVTRNTEDFAQSGVKLFNPFA
jgi:predicted nucleic acid-binding protein